MTAYYLTYLLSLISTKAITFFNSRDKNFGFFLWATFLLLLSLFASLRGEGVDRDYLNYISWFELINNEFWVAVEQKKDIGFVLLYKSLAFITEQPWFFFFVAGFIALAVKAKFASKLQFGNFAALIFILIISRFYLVHELTQVRAGLAIAIASYAAMTLLNGERFKSLFFFVIAISIHVSVIIIPLFLLVRNNWPALNKRFMLLLIPVLGIFSGGVSSLLLMFIDSQRIMVYIDTDEAGAISLLSFYYLTRMAVFYFIVFKLYQHTNNIQKLVLFFSSTSLFFNAAFAWNSVLSLRMVEVLGLFDMAMFVMPLLFMKNNSVWLYKTMLIGFSFVMFFSTTKIIQPYHTVLEWW